MGTVSPQVTVAEATRIEEAVTFACARAPGVSWTLSVYRPVVSPGVPLPATVGS